MKTDKWGALACGVIVLLVLSCSSTEKPAPASGQIKQETGSKPVSTPPKVDENDPRFQGLLQRQTLIEESGEAGDISFETKQPVYTQDYVVEKADLWAKRLSHLKNVPGARAIEIGSFEGRSTIWFLQNVLTGPSTSITCVDLFGPRLDKFFDHNIRVSNVVKRIEKLQGKSQDVLRSLPRKAQYDFAYIDGCHLATCTLSDAMLVWDLVKVGGIIMFDDYLWNLERPPIERPKTAVDAFLYVFQPYVEVLDKGMVFVVKKTAEAY